jgi:hypothetical protein
MATIPTTQKILTSSADVDTTYGGSASLKEMNTWYTMQDITDTVKPYKSLILTNVGYGFGSGINYGIVENTFDGDITVSADASTNLVVEIEELVGVNVDLNKLYVTSQDTFSAFPIFGPNLEESGVDSGSGHVLFTARDLTGTVTGIDRGQLEIRLYN